MEFPLIIVFEPPSLAELRAWLRLRRVWVGSALVVLAIGSTMALAGLGRADALASGPAAPLSIASHPSNARVWVDQDERGRTPLDLFVASGRHSVRLRTSGSVESRYELDVGGGGASLEATLFRSQPAVSHVRAALPGAALRDVRLLADGQLALSVALGPSQFEAWRLDPSSGALEPLLTDLAATRLAVAADGAHVAYLGYDIGPSASSSTSSVAPGSVLWLVQAPVAVPYAGWRAPAGDVVLDASWSPRANGLLVVTSRAVSAPDDSARTRLWWLNASGSEARELRKLPSDVVAGSESWSPDGRQVALMVHAGSLNAVCLVGIDGNFRYLADLEASSVAPLPYAPVAWASDSQRLLFVAPPQLQAPPAPSIWPQPAPSPAVYEAELSEPTPRLRGAAELALPGWLPDGRVVGLGRPRPGEDGKVSVQVLGNENRLERLLEVPLKPSRGYAAEWDARHSRALIVDRASSGATEYWAVLLGAEESAEQTP